MVYLELHSNFEAVEDSKSPPRLDLTRTTEKYTFLDALIFDLD